MAGWQLPSLLLPTTHEQAMNTSSGHRQPRLIRPLATPYHPDTSSFPRPNPAPRPLQSLTDLCVFSYFRSARVVVAPQVHPSYTQSPALASTAAWSSRTGSRASPDSSSVPPPGGMLKTSIYQKGELAIENQFTSNYKILLTHSTVPIDISFF